MWVPLMEVLSVIETPMTQNGKLYKIKESDMNIIIKGFVNYGKRLLLYYPIVKNSTINCHDKSIIQTF